MSLSSSPAGTTMSLSSSTAWLLLHLSMLRAASVADANEFRSDYKYIAEGGGWFKLHRVPLDWQTARMQCYHEGAVLASPLNGEMWTTLKKILSEAKPRANRVYSGIHATFSEGVFTSVEGTPLENLFVEWLPNQPNNVDGTQQCIVYGVGGMEDEKCSTRLPYICFRKLSVADQLTECGTVDKEYRLDARTGHCYKFHTRAETWPRALRVCQAEGGHLAVIDNKAEADVLKELFALHPHLLYTKFQNSASVGFAEWGWDKSWWTIHGKALEDTEYAEWSQGQPDNAGSSRQGCGGIFRTGKLDDVWCDQLLAFICEKTTHSLLLNEQVF